MQQLEASEMPLHRIFCADYQFEIPEYQRPYAWDPEQAAQLLEDVKEAAERADDEPYFLGSLVLVKERHEARSEVIDGQQRLTTLTILFAVLRDLADDSELQTELEKLLQEPGSMLRGLKALPRLTLRKRDTEFFLTYVQESGRIGDLIGLKPDHADLANESRDNMRKNARALHTELSTWTSERRLALMQMLTNRTYLVVVSTPDLASAHRVFSVMNARGLDLSPADIFKAQVVGAIGEDATAYSDRWEDAEDSLGRDDFADLFLHIRMIFKKERARRELLKEFPEQVLNPYLPNRAKEFIDDVVVPYSDAYSLTKNFDYTSTAGAEKVNAWLRRLDQIDNNDWRPPALWALRHHGDDPAWLDTFFRALERLAASMLIRREYTTPRVLRYADLLTQLADGLGVDSPAFSLSAEERADTVLRLAGELYLVGKVRRYVLLRLDELMADSPGVTYDHAIITVEHVLPQHPEAASIWRKWFTDDERNHWTHRIANLVLLNRKKNSQAGRLEFDEKKQKYFSGDKGVATFALTSQVLGASEWTPAILEKRQEHLLARLQGEWKLHPDSGG